MTTATVQFKLHVSSSNPDRPQMEAWNTADQLIADLQLAIDNYTGDDYLELKHLPAHFRRNPDEHTQGELLINFVSSPLSLPSSKFSLGEVVRNITDGEELHVVGLQYFHPTNTWVYIMQALSNGRVLGEFTDGALLNLDRWMLLQQRAAKWGYTWDDDIQRFRKKSISMSVKDVIFSASREDSGEEIPF